MEAAELMLDQMRIHPLSHVPMPEQEEPKEKKLLLPEPYRYQEYGTSYLRRRGIDEEIIEFCLKTGRIYESVYHHNAVFVGMTRTGVRGMQHFEESERISLERQVEVIRIIRFRLLQKRKVKRRKRRKMMTRSHLSLRYPAGSPRT